MEITVRITKEILFKSKNCGVIGMASNCAIALCLKDRYPSVFVSKHEVYPFYTENGYTGSGYSIPLPNEAIEFIKIFDRSTPEQRLELPEFEFTIDDSCLTTNY